MNQLDESWASIVRAHSGLLEGLQQLLVLDRSCERLRRELLTGDRKVALFVLPFVAEEQLVLLLPELLFLASFGHGSIGHVRRMIRRIPTEILIELIPPLAGKLLVGAEEYRRLLELYDEVASPLRAQLAAEARRSSDEEIREIGEEFER